MNDQAIERSRLMNRKTVWMAVAGAAGLAMAFAVGVAVGENSAPTESRGVQASAPTQLDLAKELDGIDGRQLRMRVVNIEPGGVVAIHSHNGRPAVAYMVQGILTEYRNAAVHNRQPGEAWSEGKEVTHWAENKGGENAVVVVVDVVKP
jgi:quercetin dioxygenase-like cupin family protein